MPSPPRILFLCTANACRSQMAEALARHVGAAHLEAFSAGSRPAGYIHELAVEAMRRMGVSIQGQRSKSWNEFADTNVDAVITLCDAAAGESCPVFPGRPVAAHWSIPDPAYFPGSDEQRIEFTLRVAESLQRKIEGLAALEWSGPRDELQQRIQFLAEV